MNDHHGTVLRRRTVVAVVLTGVLGLAGCTPRHSSALTGQPAGTAATDSSSSAVVPPATVHSSPRSTSAPRTSQQGLVVAADGAVLPNPERTPGAANPAVTPATIHSTICVSGWTATIRPPASYTTALKERQLASGYAYHGDLNPADYEEDHLISLELGGSPDSGRNLWPEPYATTDGARVKDRVENRLHTLVCSGAISLAVAQRAIATDWFAAYQEYVTVAGTPGTVAPAPSTPVAAVTSDHPAGATGRCNDGTYSYAAHHQGMCSHHGGVAVFYS